MRVDKSGQIGQTGHKKDSKKEQKRTETVCYGIESLFYELFKQFVNF